MCECRCGRVCSGCGVRGGPCVCAVMRCGRACATVWGLLLCMPPMLPCDVRRWRRAAVSDAHIHTKLTLLTPYPRVFSASRPSTLCDFDHLDHFWFPSYASPTHPSEKLVKIWAFPVAKGLDLNKILWYNRDMVRRCKCCGKDISHRHGKAVWCEQYNQYNTLETT